MVQIQEKYRPRGLQVISINTDGEYRKGEQYIRDFVTDYEKKHGLKVNFPVLYDESGAEDGYCNACFTGDYPLAVGDAQAKLAFEGVIA